jgi:predicted double-glycine peptidase
MRSTRHDRPAHDSAYRAWGSGVYEPPVSEQYERPKSSYHARARVVTEDRYYEDDGRSGYEDGYEDSYGEQYDEYGVASDRYPMTYGPQSRYNAFLDAAPSRSARHVHRERDASARVPLPRLYTDPPTRLSIHDEPESYPTRDSQIGLRRRSARPARVEPVFRDDRPLYVLDDPDERWSEPGLSTSGRQRAMIPVRPAMGLDESTAIRDFSTELDTLIAMTSARQQVVMPARSAAERKIALGPLAVSAALLVRMGLGLMVVVFLMTGYTAMTGHAPVPIGVFAGPLAGILPVDTSNQRWVMDGHVASRVQPFTQMHRADLYDNKAQFNAWGGSACSAAVLAETLTAYGMKGATIGRMIDELGPDISQQWGLLTYDGFNRVAMKHGFRADIYVNQHLTYAQMLYLTNTLGIPVIVNVRATTGYYHYLSGWHFLVMTGGDQQTVRLTDSSLYYIKSLPISTFMGMFRNRTVVIVPADYHYTLPR